MSTMIKVKNNFTDLHRWKDAPDEVSFLKNPHRHIFYVISTIEVRDDDRELEYFMVQKVIDNIIEEYVLPMPESKSCEMMAGKILDFLEVAYPDRKIIVEVNEDNENGSIITN